MSATGAKPLEGARNDIERLQGVDLSSFLPPLAPSKADDETSSSLERSYEFVKAGRAALSSSASGEVEEAVNILPI